MFQNGIFNGAFVTPSLGFAYTNANFQQLALLPGSHISAKSESGRSCFGLGAIRRDVG